MPFCVDIGGSFIKFGIADAPGVARMVARMPTPSTSWDEFSAALAGLCEAYAHEVAPGAALAISTAGLVDPDSGLVTTASNIPGIVGHRLAAELGDVLARPVRVANDADSFALAEASVGAGRGHRVVFGIIIGTGIGGGIVVDGRLVPGAGGIVGEWGHAPISKPLAGMPPVAIPRFACGCGQIGCIETLGSARGLERLHQELGGGVEDSRAIIEGWQAGAAAASRTMDIYLELVSEPLALLVNTIGPGIIPAGGGLGSVTALVEALDRTVRGMILRKTSVPLVVPAALGADAGLIGAAVLAFQGGA